MYIYSVGQLAIKPSNKELGKFFEDTFYKMCCYSGMLPMRNHIAARYGYKGELIAMKSQLDFTVIDRKQKTAFLDCKSFEGDFFTYSEIDPDQLKQAVILNEWLVPAGFVVYFRSINRVVFYTGQTIEMSGPRSRFTVDKGIDLGSLERLNLKAIFDKFRGIPL